MKRVILTGGTGFVGANLIRRLLAEGHEVNLLVRQEYSAWRIEAVRDDIRLHIVNLNDAEQLDKVVADIKPDWIFHLAAHGAYSWQTDLSCMIQTNLTATTNLVNACLKTGFEAFVNTGSSSEYGYKAYPPGETEWLEPNSHYAITKAAATMFCCYTAQKHKVHIPTVRLYSVYGPYEEPNRLMPTLITHGLNNELPPLVAPEIARDYVYTDDVNEAYLLVASKPTQKFGEVYNIGSGIQTTIRQAVELACREMAITAEIKWGSMPNRKWDTTVWVANNQKIKDELGWQPSYSFDAGFHLMINWLRENPELYRFYAERILTTNRGA